MKIPEKAIRDGKEYLFFKNGKAKKTYCACLTWYPKELYRLYGRYIIQCAGLRCPYYSVGCGRDNIERYEQAKKEKEKNNATRKNVGM